MHNFRNWGFALALLFVPFMARADTFTITALNAGMSEVGQYHSTSPTVQNTGNILAGQYYVDTSGLLPNYSGLGVFCVAPFNMFYTGGQYNLMPFASMAGVDTLTAAVMTNLLYLIGTPATPDQSTAAALAVQEVKATHGLGGDGGVAGGSKFFATGFSPGVVSAADTLLTQAMGPVVLPSGFAAFAMVDAGNVPVDQSFVFATMGPPPGVDFPVPEPGTLALFGSGLLGIAAARRRRLS